MELQVKARQMHSSADVMPNYLAVKKGEYRWQYFTVIANTRESAIDEWFAQYGNDWHVKEFGELYNPLFKSEN